MAAKAEESITDRIAELCTDCATYHESRDGPLKRSTQVPITAGVAAQLSDVDVSL